MAKKSASWANLTFQALSPVRVILLVSVLVNVVLGATLLFLNSQEGDMWIANVALTHICERDYDWLSGNLSATHNSLVGLQQYCHTDGK